VFALQTHDSPQIAGYSNQVPFLELPFFTL
jgi:hypothetical protein